MIEGGSLDAIVLFIVVSYSCSTDIFEWLFLWAVTSILLNFVSTFRKALEENAKLIEMEKKKLEKEAEKERMKNSPHRLDQDKFRNSPTRRENETPFSPRRSRAG